MSEATILNTLTDILASVSIIRRYELNNGHYQSHLDLIVQDVQKIISSIRPKSEADLVIDL